MILPKKPFTFTAKDFEVINLRNHNNLNELFAAQANRILDAYLASCPIVYSSQIWTDRISTQWFTEMQIDDVHGQNWSNRKAYLFNIELLVSKPESETADE